MDGKFVSGMLYALRLDNESSTLLKLKRFARWRDALGRHGCFELFFHGNSAACACWAAEITWSRASPLSVSLHCTWPCYFNVWYSIGPWFYCDLFRRFSAAWYRLSSPAHNVPITSQWSRISSGENCSLLHPDPLKNPVRRFAQVSPWSWIPSSTHKVSQYSLSMLAEMHWSGAAELLAAAEITW